MDCDKNVFVLIKVVNERQNVLSFGRGVRELSICSSKMAEDLMVRTSGGQLIMCHLVWRLGGVGDEVVCASNGCMPWWM